MPTIKQEKALGKMVENGGNASQAMREVGYSKKTAKTPQKLTESKGFNQLLSVYGLTEELVVKALVSDIKGKPKQRLGELSLASDIMGLRKKGIIIANQFSVEEQKRDKPHYIDPTNPRVIELLQELGDIRREELQESFTD